MLLRPFLALGIWVVVAGALQAQPVALGFFGGAGGAGASVGSPGPFRPGHGTLVELPIPDPVGFVTPEGRPGLRLPLGEGRPLQTPAVAQGKVFLGNGFGATGFFALDARSLARVWSFQGGDPGASAAAVSEGVVTYNTESCTLFAHDAETGQMLWSHWLGDPVLGQPAMGPGKVYAVYPAADSHHLASFDLRSGRLLWDQPVSAEVVSAPVVSGDTVYLATVDGHLGGYEAQTGKVRWRSRARATSAPMPDGDSLWIGQRHDPPGGGLPVERLSLVAAGNGGFWYPEGLAPGAAPFLLTAESARRHLARSRLRSASPVTEARAEVLAGVREQLSASGDPEAVRLARRIDRFLKQGSKGERLSRLRDRSLLDELVQALGEIREAESRRSPPSASVAHLFDEPIENLRFLAAQGEPEAPDHAALESAYDGLMMEEGRDAASDASVGFSRSPPMGRLELAAAHLGVGSVRGVQSYQGGRPTLAGDRVVMVSGSEIRAVARSDGRPAWTRRIEVRTPASRPLSTPAHAGGKLYLGTADGRVLCIDPGTGNVVWQATVGGTLRAEPVVADDALFAASEEGDLIRLELGESVPDAWPGWGGSASHAGELASGSGSPSRPSAGQAPGSGP